jgi:hypothetical protein
MSQDGQQHHPQRAQRDDGQAVDFYLAGDAHPVAWKP